MTCKPHATRPQGTCFPERSIRIEVSSVQKIPERYQIGSEVPEAKQGGGGGAIDGWTDRRR